MDRPVLLDKVATEPSAGAASGQAPVQTSRSGIEATTEKGRARSQSNPRPTGNGSLDFLKAGNVARRFLHSSVSVTKTVGCCTPLSSRLNTQLIPHSIH